MKKWLLLAALLFVVSGCQQVDLTEKVNPAVNQGTTDTLNAGQETISPIIPDKLIYDKGIVRYIKLEGGFFGIIGKKGNYEPINLPREYQIDGLHVVFTATLKPSLSSIHMWGKLIEIIKIAKVEPQVYNAQFGQEFKLPINDIVSVSGLYTRENVKIRFLDVLADSRCPKGAECIWQGEGVIKLNVVINGIDQGNYKMTTLDNPSVLTIGRYSIYFTGLYPYPVLGTPINPNDYVATFIVKN